MSHTTHTATRYKIKGHSALVVQAGTAASDRGRGEENSFNVVRVDRPRIAVERFAWSAERDEFALTTTEHFRHTADGWIGT